MVLALVVPMMALAGLQTPTLYPERFYAPLNPAGRYDRLEEIQAVDFDGDGREDIVGTFDAAALVGSLPDGVFVQRGIGRNELEPVAAEPVPGTVRGFAVEDFDGDGQLDIVAAHASPSGWTIYRGTGGGHLAPGVTTALNDPSPRVIGASDMDLDGVVDIVLTTSNDTRVVPGLGGGAFGAPVVVLPSPLFGARIADVDGQNGLDLVGLGGVVLGTATPLVFQSPIPLPLDFLLGPNLFEVGEVTGDGILDVLVSYDTQFSPDVVQILAGLGNGQFVKVLDDDQALVDFIIDMEVGDVNGDGLGDAVLFVSGFGLLPTVVVYPSLGAGSFEPPVFHDDMPFIESLDLADFDGDGRDDLAIGLDGYPRTGVLLAGPKGDFPRPTLVDFGQRMSNIELVPLDGDSKDDLIFTRVEAPNNKALIALQNTGDGGFVPSDSVFIADSPRDLGIADLDSDGKLDVVTIGETPVANSLRIHLGLGDGTLQANGSLSGALGPRGLALGDLDSNGTVDIATVYSSGTFMVHPGLPGGTFDTPDLTAYSPILTGIAVGDLDADGRDDVLIVDGSLDELLIRYQDAAGDLEPAVRLSTLPACCAAFEQGRPLLGHWNADPYMDIAIDAKDGLAVHLSTGARSYGSPRLLRGVAGSFAPATEDFNGDGNEDLVLFGSTIAILFGDGQGAFPEIHHYLAPPSGADLAVGNIDGRSGLDIVICPNSKLFNGTQVGAVLLNRN